ncbi:MAG TPA: hypothetical protein VI942_11390 [Thermoanaerobaculia bacterium]|nr:hypothetical protein [Thermoanaerobaculia bacterium]
MSDSQPDRDVDREHAAAALASLRAAVRQRRAELATTGGAGDELGAQLAELRRREFVQEPQPVSPRPGFGRLIVAVRKAFHYLFLKWHSRAVLQQQNEFNQIAGSLVATLAERDHETRQELGRLRQRLAELEARLERAEDGG